MDYHIRMRPNRRLTLLSLLAAVCTVTLHAADISGKWLFTWDTEGGIRNTEWTIAQNGESLTIQSEGQKFAGTLKDGQFQVEGQLYAAEAGYTAMLKVEGRLEGDVLKGRGTWDQYAMTFTAKRAE